MLNVVDVELTPNPHAIKFVLNEKLLQFEARQFQTAAGAENDPLAKRIFELPGVVSVFYTDKFITIEKSPGADWAKIQRPFMQLIHEFDKAAIPAETDVPAVSENMGESSPAQDELLKKINEVINQKVMPALAYDGGGLQVIGLEGNTLRVKYQGACGSCPSATRGTLMAIENLLRRDVHPGISVIPA